MSRAIILTFAIVACAACAKAPEAPKATDTPTAPAAGSGPLNPVLEAATYAPALQVDLKGSTKSASGLYYRDLVVGTGAVAEVGKQVTAKYDGTFIDGRRFDSGVFPFLLGARRVILGWDEGVAGMKVGGKRQLIVPSDLGYGPNGDRGIPGGAILVFMVDLVAVQ